MSAYSPPLRPIIGLCLAGLLAGCASVGPNWHGAPVAAPDAAARPAFLRAPANTDATAPSARWWEALGDPVLDDLITRALTGSPDLAAARARIAQSRATLSAAKGALLPAVNVGGVAGEASLPGALLSRNGRLSEQIYGDDFDASWEVDLFGANRRRVEAARDRADASLASAADVAVALSAEVARAYVALRAEQASAALLERQVDCDRRLVGHAQDRFAHGTTPEQSVDSARSTLAQSESDLAASRAQITVLADQLAVLIGREPGALDALAAKPAPVPLVPAHVAVGDPARLLRHRPDIRLAERQLAAANADLGARIADRFPTISFTGVLGLGGTRVGEAFAPSTLIGLILPQIKWNLFDGGRAAAQVRAAHGARDEAEAQYRSRVLAALEDAEASLTRFGNRRITLAKAVEQRDAAAHLAALQETRAQGGTLSRADALSSERQTLRAELGTVSAKAQLTTDFIAVEKALGLGWESEAPQE
ncbi:efflux transporter outer membrane subunit [Novosphingobium sp. Fuku2-ISO-50]|uniref:efflux transporter outer membrane subunit n=1 Tax=Novosphingobium sp. Fuku2-ISO-50 TaxID=1739114 RepID=UPI0009EC5A4A|nr:efflux transporter outer membrane subunit [Novosphingobium sp. Fuku2-ISO-50]